MHRFYFHSVDFTKKNISITDKDELHHIKDVLRLKAGDKLSIFNGQNQEALAVISSVKENEIIAVVESVREADKGGARVILCCAVPKKAKFEFIIEKCTELGVHSIIPLRTKRTEVIYSADKNPLKQERFQKVAINASKQCGRIDVPTVHQMTDFKTVFSALPEDALVLIASLTRESIALKDALGKAVDNRPIALFIGPEGDFTAEEVDWALKQGAQSISLGNTILKVDTAAMTSVAFCRYLLYN